VQGAGRLLTVTSTASCWTTALVRSPGQAARLRERHCVMGCERGSWRSRARTRGARPLRSRQSSTGRSLRPWSRVGCSARGVGAWRSPRPPGAQAAARRADAEEERAEEALEEGAQLRSLLIAANSALEAGAAGAVGEVRPALCRTGRALLRGRGRCGAGVRADNAFACHGACEAAALIACGARASRRMPRADAAAPAASQAPQGRVRTCQWQHRVSRAGLRRVRARARPGGRAARRAGRAAARA